MFPHFLDKVHCPNLMRFCILNCVPMKGSCQTYGGNFIRSQLISQFYRTFCKSAHIFLTQNHIVNQVIILFSVGTVVYCNLWVCWLRRCLWKHLWNLCIGCKGTALSSGWAESDSSRCKTIKYSHQPQRRSEDLWLRHQWQPCRFSGKDYRCWLQAVHGS